MEEETKRSRRSTKFSGDFQTHFKDLSSDEDYDDDESSKRRRSSGRSGPGKPRGRHKECPGCGSNVGVAVKVCPSCDYQFSSKSMLMAAPSSQTAAEESQSIRDRFLFEPEREEDGSLIIQAILGRRLRSTGKRWLRHSAISAGGLADVGAMDAKFEHEYLVKYKSLSYLHVQWLSANDIDSMNAKSRQVLQRYLNKLDRGDPSAQEDGEIDPTFTEVEKILDDREEEVNEVVDVAIESKAADTVQLAQEDEDGSATPADQTQQKQQKSKKLQKEELDEELEATGEEQSSGSRIKRNASSSGLTRTSSGAAISDGTSMPEERLSANQIFQHPQRCLRVLDKICEDPYAVSFLEPVDTTLYVDYLDVIDEPMSLQDVRKKLEAGEYNKYMMHRKFAMDMRLIWQNCKMYNLYKSQIWYSAHVLSMEFERLYQAWVLSFSDGLIGIDEAVGQPWEPTCRICQQEEDDEKVMLCDHCDASYHIYCLTPPLTKIPEGVWMCARCERWISRTGAKVLSATAEDEMRTIAESAGHKKVVRRRKKKFLVKWRGLSFKECTWETVEDINDDLKIAEYHKINDNPPEEPALTQAEISVELSKDRRTMLLPPMYPNAVQDLDAAVYAQIRAMHFLKWKRIPPAALLKECGAAGLAVSHMYRTPMLVHQHTAATIQRMQTEAASFRKKFPDLSETSLPKMGISKAPRPTIDNSLTWIEPIRDEKMDPIREEVADVLSNIVFSVARSIWPNPYPTRPKLPPPHPPMTEIEICVAKGSSSLCMKVGNFRGRCVVLGFKPNDRNQRGPAERTGRIKAGDIVTAINGYSVLDMKFLDILTLLSIKTPYMYLRLMRSSTQNYYDRLREYRESFNKPSSTVGAPVPAGPLMQDPFDIMLDYIELLKEETESRRAIPLRSLYLGVFPAKYGSGHPWEVLISNRWKAKSSKEHYSFTSVGHFDDEVDAAHAYDEEVDKLNCKFAKNFDTDGKLTPDAQLLFRRVSEERRRTKTRETELAADLPEESKAPSTQAAATSNGSTVKPAAEPEATAESAQDSQEPAKTSENGHLHEGDDSNASDEEPGQKASEAEMEVEDLDSLDSRDSDSELASKSSETDTSDSEADDDNWDSGDDNEWKPSEMAEGDGPVSRLLRAVNESDYPPIRAEWANYVLEMGLVKKPATTTRVRSKIDQFDMETGAVVGSWDSAASVSRSLNIPIADITAALLGKAESAGGFRWEITQTVDTTANVEEEESDPTVNESWKAKLHLKSKEYYNGGTLRDYQLDGLNWLLRCWYQKRSSILADEMGLGKTAQVVAFLDHLFEVEGIRGPFLISVPLSTIEHWKREAEGWSRMNVCLYHDTGGGRDMRDVIREYDWYYKNRSRRLFKFHVLITTYDDLIRDYEELAEVPWRVVVVDEAHRLRNVNSKLLECMRSVVAKGLSSYGYQHRVLMTGTPLQNNTAELWSLLNFIEPAKFPDAEKFQERFGNIQTQEQVESLQRRIAPHLLRRVKEDVAKDIPPKEETIIDVELTTMQKQFYRAIFEHNHGFLMQSLKSGSMPKLMNIQMELRKCCNHPFLIAGVEQTEMEAIESQVLEEMARKNTKRFDRASFEMKRVEQVLLPTSGKMVLIDKLLPKLRKEGHKVLIFSQMVKMIDLIEEYCEFRKYTCERLDGRVGGNDRQKAIDRFNQSPDSFVFLLSTRAGGVGINLTAADTVIIFDSDWNPQNDVQAMARCHRIGQQKHVTIYRLITRRSFEAEMFERASKKLGLEQALLGSRQFIDQEIEDSKAVKMDAKEMEQLLREGAYAVLLEDDTENIREFCEQDIDTLLERRSHVLVSEQGTTGTESWSSKRNKARKSLFTGDTSAEHAEIDVNDPDFWKKVLPDLVTPESMLQRLSDGSLLDDEDGEPIREIVDKFMRDLAQMMEGMLDLTRRNQLPERERNICMKLLLRITLKEDVFEEEERVQSSEWLSVIEGTRVRKMRQEIYSPGDHQMGGRGGRGRGRGRGSGRGGRGEEQRRRLSRRFEEDEEEEDDDILDEDAYEESDDGVAKKHFEYREDSAAKKRRKRRRRLPDGRLVLPEEYREMERQAALARGEEYPPKKILKKKGPKPKPKITSSDSPPLPPRPKGRSKRKASGSSSEGDNDSAEGNEVEGERGAAKKALKARAKSVPKKAKIVDPEDEADGEGDEVEDGQFDRDYAAKLKQQFLREAGSNPTHEDDDGGDYVESDDYEDDEMFV